MSPDSETTVAMARMETCKPRQAGEGAGAGGRERHTEGKRDREKEGGVWVSCSRKENSEIESVDGQETMRERLNLLDHCSTSVF